MVFVNIFLSGGGVFFPPSNHETDVLRLIQTIPLPGVKGRMDHLTLDATGQRLWLAALENNSVEVIDLGAGKRIQSIDGPKEPQGVCLVLSRVVVAGGEDGIVRFFDYSMKQAASLKGMDDADNVRYDPREKRLYVGYGKGALGVIDAQKSTKLSDIPLDGHPESFQLEQHGRRIFVNVPTAGEIAVIDRTKGAVIAKWPVKDAKANFPMALDETNRRLFIGCRQPARMLVLDTQSGKTVAKLDCCGDVDDLFYDAAHNRVYLCGGEGCISVFEQIDADHYKPIAKVATAPGARTCLFVAETNRLYLAVPHRGGQEAQVRVYQVQP